MNSKKYFFELIKSKNEYRLGKLHTSRGYIETPAFMPVGTQGTIKSIFPDDMLKTGTQIILGNTYHLLLRPGVEKLKKFNGLHNFMNWNKPILTDSGGYQVWSLSKLRKINEHGINFVSHIDGKKIELTPESAIQIQERLNSDISMVLDECTEYPASFSRAEESMELSIRWANRCKNTFTSREGFGLFGIIQGGMFETLRKKCSEKLSKIGFDGYALGGLSVGESHEEMIKSIDFSLENIDEDKPRYLMGVGRPIDIFAAVERGVDMFDCVLPTRFGRNGRAFTSNGEINLRNAIYLKDDSPLDEGLDLYVSQNFSKSYIHHLVKNNEILACMILSLHNIAFYKKMMCDIRESIINKKFYEIKKKYFENHEKHKRT